MPPEPWLRGPIPDVHPLTAPILYAFQQAREDLHFHTEHLSTEQLWATPFGLGSAAFHILHIAGSTDRLMTYLKGMDLSPGQMEALEAESHPPRLDRGALLAWIDEVFVAAEETVRSIDPAALADPRTVGRKRLPTTLIGLLTHIAEHTQRHVGQAISAAKLAARLGSSEPV